MDEDEFSVTAQPKKKAASFQKVASSQVATPSETSAQRQAQKPRMQNQAFKSKAKQDDTDDFAIKKRPTTKSRSSDDGFSLPNLTRFMSGKTWTVISIIVLLLISFSVSWYFRSMPSDLPATKDWAFNNVAAYYKNMIGQQVNQQYPNLPAASKNQIIEQEWQKFYESNKATVESNVNDARVYFKKNLQDDNGLTYISNIDSFYFLRKTKTIVEKGTYYDAIIDGRPIDTYMLAPLGIVTEPDFHSAFAAVLYKVMHAVNASMTVNHAAFYTPIILASLCVIPIFFIVRKKTGNFAGFLASLILVLHPVFLGRTMGGDFDNDVYNVFFPLLISWIFLEIIEAKSLRRKLILTALNGFMIGVLAFAWRGGWWYIFDFLVAALLVYLWYKTLKTIIGRAVEKNLMNMSKFWTRAILFFGPIILCLILFLIWKPLGLVFFAIYALCIGVAFVVFFTGIIKEWLKKKTLHKDHEDVVATLLVLIVFVVFSLIFVSWFMGFDLFMRGPLQPLRITTLQQAAHANLWPNVYTTVAELNVTDIGGIVSQISGFGGFGNTIHLFFIIALMGISFTLIKKKMNWKDWTFIGFSLVLYTILMTNKALTMPSTTYLALFGLPLLVGFYLLLDDDTTDIKYAIFLVLWFTATLYAGTKGIRFIHLLLPAFCVGFGVAIGRIYEGLNSLAINELHVDRRVSKLVFGLIILLLLITPLKAANAVARSNVPIFDRTWYDAMDTIKKDSQPDAIINSWWDFGHFFKAQADRRVTFDGAIQNTPPAHWIGRALSTDNEDETMGILRMLDCGSNTAYDLLINATGDPLTAIKIVQEIIVVDKAAAHQILQGKGFKPATIDAVLSNTHCTPPEDYFITSGDMVGKAGVWAHFGYWDFERAFIYLNAKDKPRQEAMDLLVSRLNLSVAQADQYVVEVQGLTTDRNANSWISPWPGYVTSQVMGCARVNETVECRINLGVGQNAQTTTVIEAAVINLTDYNSSYLSIGVYDKALQTKLGGSLEKPRNFVITGPDDFMTIPVGGTFFPYDVVVDTYNNRMIIADSQLSKSTFTKLYYFDGMYMAHFDKKFDARGVSGVDVKVWKVDWDGKDSEETKELKKKWGIERPKPIVLPENFSEDVAVDVVNETVA